MRGNGKMALGVEGRLGREARQKTGLFESTRIQMARNCRKITVYKARRGKRQGTHGQGPEHRGTFRSRAMKALETEIIDLVPPTAGLPEASCPLAWFSGEWKAELWQMPKAGGTESSSLLWSRRESLGMG